MVTRRRFVQMSAMAGMAALTSQEPRADERERVRDRFGLWSHHPGVYDGMFGLPRNSRMTPVEAAKYLGTPNIMFIRAAGKPAYPFEEYAAAFKDVKKLQWSITGSSGATSNEEREYVLRLAASMPNITGLYMDDFFNFAREGQEGSMTVGEVKAIRDRMTINGRRLELGIVVYTADKFDDRMRPYLELCDEISLWSWSAKELDELEANFAKLKELAPGKRLQMGCYMWDYGPQQPMPLERIERQCTMGLKWLREKRIGDMIFCGAHLCDQGLEAVEATRNWIATVGDQPLYEH
ncbi:MAG TPA: twin-arginine translocation signal domain-containing protein [Candidatus Hydrogenedentes bacterium]|nr:twin-arginine translocation signal domain-containing protein [Candidatus Hydrogenedentota bacterium]HQH54005.1 twin-arginine translocation signal domain-containing protein [Candidatus Hydrogenedentota bacterium]